MKYYNFLVSSILVVCFSLFSSCKKGLNIEISHDGTKTQNASKASDAEKHYQSKEVTVLNFSPRTTTGVIIRHKYFSLSYNEKAEQAEWVAYELKKSYLKNNNYKRPYFNVDPKVKTGSADWRNYRKSGYDKGHLCPAGDMEFDIEAYNDTFFTSNISPQVREFNGGVWNRLEQKVRYWAAVYEGVFVVTGGVLNSQIASIGDEKVIVPKYFYKILLDNSKGNYKMIAFLIPNEKSERPLYDFVVSVDSIEKMTGIDFFPILDDEMENRLEKSNDVKGWIFN